MRRLNALTITLRSLSDRALPTALTLLLMALGTAMLTFVLCAAAQLEDAATRDARGIDLVVGPKGSPLQLVLSTVYHLDNATATIPAETQSTVGANRFVKRTVPLAIGDSYRGYRLVGTTADYVQIYHAAPGQGRMFAAPGEVVFGATAAAATGVHLGMAFHSSHGLAAGGEEHEETSLNVVGILKPTGTVIDRLVLTPVETIWALHEGSHAVPSHADAALAAPQRALSAVLVQYASPLAALGLPRVIDAQPSLQAAQPALESAKLAHMLGATVQVLRAVAGLLLGCAALAMFVALFHALEERRRDLALLRVLGAPPGRLMRLLLAEGLVLSVGGAALGWLGGHAAVEAVGSMCAREYGLVLSGLMVASDEIWLLPLALAIGAAAGLLPAWRAYRIPFAASLSD